MSFTDVLNYSLIKTRSIHISVETILVSAIAIIITLILLKLTKRIILRRFEKNQKIDSGSLLSIFQIIRYLIWIISILFILNFIGFKLTIILASSAALLIGLGLGIQQIFNDYVSGLLILFEQNIKIGNILEIENDIVGKIESIGIRTSKLKTRDDIVVVIPNSKLISENTINWSHLEGNIRFHVNIGVAYGSDTMLVKEVLIACASQIKEISTKPAAFVRFLDFGESSLDFQLLFWTTYSFAVENIKSDLRFIIDKEFQENGIRIPFPQRDLHIITDKTK